MRQRGEDQQSDHSTCFQFPPCRPPLSSFGLLLAFHLSSPLHPCVLLSVQVHLIAHSIFCLSICRPACLWRGIQLKLSSSPCQLHHGRPLLTFYTTSLPTRSSFYTHTHTQREYIVQFFIKCFRNKWSSGGQWTLKLLLKSFLGLDVKYVAEHKTVKTQLMRVEPDIWFFPHGVFHICHKQYMFSKGFFFFLHLF